MKLMCKSSKIENLLIPNYDAKCLKYSKSDDSKVWLGKISDNYAYAVSNTANSPVELLKPLSKNVKDAYDFYKTVAKTDALLMNLNSQNQFLY